MRESVIAKVKRTKLADELVIANSEKADRADELVIANLEKANRAAELVIANLEKADRVAELVIADAEKAKRADELIIANKELVFQNSEKAKRADELIASNKELNQLLQLNTSKDRFISILGHDLKSPFNNLLGLSELLSENIHNYDIDEIEKLVNGINISAQNAHNLLDDLLVWASSQQGSLTFNPQNISLIDVCTGVIKTLKPIADAKNIRINCLAEDHLNVFADTDMLKTILRNLVSNAIKFTTNGGVINISAEQNSEVVTISVSDNGIGIAPDDLSKLFDISEVHTTTGTAKETGTGQGLLICKEFIEKQQGRIWVESEVGKGSDFKFTLPRHTEPDDVNVAKNNTSSSVADNNIATLKILIIDDDEVSRMLLGISVKMFAKEIVYAQNGFEAVEACKNNPDLDLALMDIKMPKMDGIEATRQIRQLNKEVVIIAQSAHIDSGEKAKVAGCSDFITKPINKILLVELIKKHCNR